MNGPSFVDGARPFTIMVGTSSTAVCRVHSYMVYGTVFLSIWNYDLSCSPHPLHCIFLVSFFVSSCAVSNNDDAQSAARFRILCEAHQERYERASTKTEKSLIVTEILHAVQEGQGAFVKQVCLLSDLLLSSRVRRRSNS